MNNIHEIYDALAYGDAHGPGLFPEGKDPGVWQTVRTSAFHRAMVDEVRAEAEKLLHEPITALPFSLYRLFDETGSRKEFEQAYFHRRLRLNTFAIMAMIDDDPVYVRALEDTIWAICDEYSWCIPAGMQGRSLIIPDAAPSGAADGRRLAPTPREHDRIVDLFAAELAFALAEVLHLTGDRLAGLVVHRARQAVRERVLEPFMAMNAMFFWERVSNNWAAVCAGSIGAAAMYLIDDADMLAPVLHRALSATEAFLSGYGADGACTEGIGYWHYGFGFFTYFAALLHQRTGGKIDLFADEKVKQIALFQQWCYLSGDQTVPFSDAPLRAPFPVGLVHYLKARYAEVEVPDSRYGAKFTSDHCYRWAPAVRAFVWARPEYADSRLPDEASRYFPDAEWLVSRCRTPSGSCSFAAKGGHNSEPHNHNDIGSFVYHLNGETLLTDPGMGEYTKAYFGPDRYSFLVTRSSGHSVPIVEGGEQRAGREHRATVLSHSVTDAEDSFVLDIASAYGNGGLQSLIRSFRLRKSGVAELEIKDEYRFVRTPSAVVERFVTPFAPQLVEEGRLRIAGEHGAADILYDAGRLDVRVERTSFMSHRANIHHRTMQIELSLIDFTVRQPADAMELTFRVVPVDP